MHIKIGFYYHEYISHAHTKKKHRKERKENLHMMFTTGRKVGNVCRDDLSIRDDGRTIGHEY